MRCIWLSYCGHCGEKEPDLILYPDYDTFSILPWRPQQGKVARLICDMRRADGSEHEMSSRYILKKTAQAAEEAGYTCYVDPECEFFLFHIDDNGMPTTVSHEKGRISGCKSGGLRRKCKT